MSGARFARSGRARFFLCFLALVLMLGMVAIFQNTTRQLDKSREQQLQCEQQQLTLNNQLQSFIEQKQIMQKNYDVERSEQMQTKLELEQKLKKHTEQLEKEKLDSNQQYKNLQQTLKLLQNDYKNLEEKYAKSKDEYLEKINSLNFKLQDVQSKAEKEKNDFGILQENYNLLLEEKRHLEQIVNTADNKSRLLQMEHIISEYQTHCSYEPKGVSSLAQLQINKPQILAKNSSPQTGGADALANKSFSEQVRVSDGLYLINIIEKSKTITNATTNQTNLYELTANKVLNTTSAAGDGIDANSFLTTIVVPFVEQSNNRSLILNSVENFQILPKMYKKLGQESQTVDKIISPLSAPFKPTESTELHKLLNNKLEQQMNISHVSKISLSSTSSLPPLPLPPQQQEQQQISRKLPENVAPIPQNFEDLLKNEEQQQEEQKQEQVDEQEQHANIGLVNEKAGDKKQSIETQGDANVAAKSGDKFNKGDINNNRYANIVNDMAVKQENSALLNDKNFNVPSNNEEDNNFFEAVEPKNNVNNNANDDFVANGVDGDLPAVDAGDIAVKQNKDKLLDTENGNNELAADQGKEFDEGLHMEEDPDEDDYSNIAARHGEQVIRN